MKIRITIAGLLLRQGLLFAQRGSADNPLYQSEVQTRAAADPGDPPLEGDPLDAEPVPLNGWLPWLAVTALVIIFTAGRREFRVAK